MLKVLVVDDDGPIRHWLAYCVHQMEGFVLAGAAASGQQALDLYRRELPDIVITDIEMTGMSGLELVERIQRLRPSYVIILTSHSNFAYVRQALYHKTADYILKTEVSLEKLGELLIQAEQKLQKTCHSLQTKWEQKAQMFLRKLAVSDSAPPLTVDHLRRHGILLEDERLIAGDLWSQEPTELQTIQEILTRHRAMTHIRFVPLDHEHLLMVGNLRYEEGLQELLSSPELQRELTQGVLGFSSVWQGVEMLPHALQEARARCQMSFYQPGIRLFGQQSPGIRGLRWGEGAKIQLSKALLAQHYLEAMTIKDQILEQIAQERPTPPQEVRQLCLSLCAIVLHCMTEHTHQVEDQMAHLEQQFLQATAFEDVRREVDQVFLPLSQQLECPAYSSTVGKAIAYMRAHYQERLTLGRVAGEVHFNAEYLSRRFLRETGVHFSVFLNNLRMQRAVELLEGTDRRIYQIAEEVGYASLSYFSTAFKRTFGKTPAEYQNWKRQDVGQREGGASPGPQKNRLS